MAAPRSVLSLIVYLKPHEAVELRVGVRQASFRFHSVLWASGGGPGVMHCTLSHLDDGSMEQHKYEMPENLCMSQWGWAQVDG